MLNNGSMDREYIVSESWSQASVITKDYKLGIMLDPTSARKDLDYRDFGDMFFDRSKDPLEIENGIDDPTYKDQIDLLMKYYDEYVQNTPATGKAEMIEKLLER